MEAGGLIMKPLGTMNSINVQVHTQLTVNPVLDFTSCCSAQGYSANMLEISPNRLQAIKKRENFYYRQSPPPHFSLHLPDVSPSVTFGSVSGPLTAVCLIYFPMNILSLTLT